MTNPVRPIHFEPLRPDSLALGKIMFDLPSNQGSSPLPRVDQDFFCIRFEGSCRNKRLPSRSLGEVADVAAEVEQLRGRAATQRSNRRREGSEQGACFCFSWVSREAGSQHLPRRNIASFLSFLRSLGVHKELAEAK